MSVNPVQCWTVRCDVDSSHVHYEPGHSATLFLSYESAVSLAKLDGWVFRPYDRDRVLCPACAKAA